MDSEQIFMLLSNKIIWGSLREGTDFPAIPNIP